MLRNAAGWFYIENVLRLPCFAQISHSFSSYLLGQALFELGSIKILVFVELPTSLLHFQDYPFSRGWILSLGLNCPPSHVPLQHSFPGFLTP